MSYKVLEELLAFDKPIPVTENWAAAADFLRLVSGYCLENKPKTIVECSSGTSSLVLSQCCHVSQCGHVYSLENGLEFANKTQQWLSEFSLSDHCDVIHAPLKAYQLGEECYQWYDIDNFSVDQIDVLVIDGPPGFIQKNSRYPALPLLANLLSKKCIIFLDDAARNDERKIVKKWLEHYPEFELSFIDNERGCSVLQR